MTETRADLAGIAPFFIVRDLAATIAFYRDRMGFEITFQGPDPDPFFAIVARGGAAIHLKSHEGIDPVTNCARHPRLRFDAHVYAPDPDAHAAELTARGCPFSAPLADDDGLRGFEVTDPDGHVLFFGWPR